jgi:hypothetical protein
VTARLTAAATTTPLSLFDQRSRLERRIHRRAIGWSRLRRRGHTEEAEEQRHQRCDHYSLHLVCLLFLLSSFRDEDGETIQHISNLS